MDNILQIMAGLAGLGGFISVLVNLLKRFGVVQNGDADKWFEGINVLAFLAIAIVYFWQQPIDWGQVDEWLKLLASLIGLVVQTVGGKVTYNALRGLPIMGFSHELNKE